MYVCVAENGEMLVFFLVFFPNNSLIFHVRLGKKGEMLVFTGVYVCVRAKLTLVSFFFLVFLAPFPYFHSKKTMVLQLAEGWFPDSNVCINSPCWIWLCNSQFLLIFSSTVPAHHLCQEVSWGRFEYMKWQQNMQGSFFWNYFVMTGYFVWSFQCEGVNAKKRKE